MEPGSAVRWTWTLLVTALLAGCAGGEEPQATPDTPQESCAGTLSERTFWLAPGHALAEGGAPAAGSVFSNGFDEAFLVDDMDVWLSEPVADRLWVPGNVTLEFWARNHGTPAPVVVGGDPGEGYHWFNQFGSDRSFVMDYGREYAEVAPAPGSIDHYVKTIAMPEGGFFVEPGDRLRLLLTSLVVDDGQERGQEVLFGGDTPSHVRLEAACVPALEYDTVDSATHDVAVAAHQGLITGAVPATEGVNHADVAFTLREATDRLTVSLMQTGDANPAKDDMDLTIHDAGGAEVASIGSPYSDEQGVFWAPNLAAFLPPGDYTVRVNSYSGHAYEGEVAILQERALLAGGASQTS